MSDAVAANVTTAPAEVVAVTTSGVRGGAGGTGGFVSMMWIEKPSDVWLPAASDATHVAVKGSVVIGTKFGVPSTDIETVPDGPVRVQSTDAEPWSSDAVTTMPTFAPPVVLPWKFARPLTSPILSVGGVTS